MSDVRRLLEAVEPGPWWHDGAGVIYGNDGDEVASGNGSAAHLVDQSERAALIVYAVNRLPDYEAAVDALAAAIPFMEDEWVGTAGPIGDGGEWIAAARAAVARLRGAVPA